jgi:cysteine synthase B
LEGLKHLATAATPGIFDPRVADVRLSVATEDAYAMARRLSRQEGLFVGISSGAALAASLTVASRLESGVIVTIFPDGGARYGSERFWTGHDEGRAPW